MLLDLLKFFINKNSENAGVLCIDLAQYMNDRDLDQISDYLHNLRKSR